VFSENICEIQKFSGIASKVGELGEDQPGDVGALDVFGIRWVSDDL
jgi:hypothetical protein